MELSLRENEEPQTYEEKVEKEDHGGGNVQGLGDGGGGGGLLPRHHRHHQADGRDLAVGAEGQLRSEDGAGAHMVCVGCLLSG